MNKILTTIALAAGISMASDISVYFTTVEIRVHREHTSATLAHHKALVETASLVLKGLGAESVVATAESKKSGLDVLTDAVGSGDKAEVAVKAEQEGI